MTRPSIRYAVFAACIVLAGAPGCFLGNGGGDNPQYALASVVRREIRSVINSNGIIEPADRTDIYAPIDGMVTGLESREGAEVRQGQLLMRLESKPLQTALAEARAGLLEARIQARTVMAGASREELTAADSTISETELQWKQQREDLDREEDLLKKGATTGAAVEAMRKEIRLLELRLDSLRQKKQALLNRYSPEEKELSQSKVEELTRQAALLEQQVQMGSILVPRSGILYMLAVKAGSFAGRGTLLAQVYEPGKVRLRAYVDEPDLGRIAERQQVLVEWDGMPGKQWTAVVEQPARQVVALGNRSVGNVICAVEGNPKELIPNLNVKIQIVTATKADALVVPRTAVFNQDGQPTVLLFDGKSVVPRRVSLGLVTTQDIEILQGVAEGDRVAVNPGEASAR